MNHSDNQIVKTTKTAGVWALLPIAAGIFINLLCTTIAGKAHIPLFLDTIGTILASVLGGYLPGIITALATNLLKGIFESYSVYYGILNVLIAICTVYFVKKDYFKRITAIILYVVLLAVIGGVFGGILAWLLGGFASDERYEAIISYIYGNSTFHNKFLLQIVVYFFVDLVDKALTVLVAMLLIKVLPERVKVLFQLKGWQQTPLSDELKETVEEAQYRSRSLRTKIILVLVFASVSLAAVATWISLRLFQNYTIDQHIEIADGVAGLAGSVIDAEHVDDYLEKGEDVEGYRETEKLLYSIRESSPDVEYLYVYKIMDDGCHVVFDLDTEDVEASELGEVIEFDEAFLPYLPALKAGEEIEPLISDEKFGWLLTVYKPVYDKDGKCVCYAAADVAMKDLAYYQRDFCVKMVSLFFGFFSLILAIGLWLAEYHIILPINSMACCASAFAYDSDVAREENVERIRNLDIKTGDEVENLYHAFSKTTEDSMYYVEDIQRKTEMIADMQRGLIMVLADMVENRDQSTGDHVRKTAAYVALIMEEMKKKGYYADMLTDDYINDVVASAPLHDVGKIQIPDAILNKPGKLTDEEFEIMKSHTTAGEKIMTQAIESVPGADYLREAKNLATYHHEKWNGKGYPRGLAGEEIPLSARVMAVADVFDALVSKRCYKAPFTFEKAMSIIKEDAGSHFDPLVADAFLGAEEKVREITERFERLSQENEAQAQEEQNN